MWYKQALKIGKSEGIIQCTYAILYDEKGDPLFALQRKKFEDEIPVNNSDYGDYAGEDVLIPYLGAGAEGVVLWNTGSNFTGRTETGYIVFDMPLVEATQYSSEKYVPVKLLYDAKVYLLRTITSSKQYGWDGEWWFYDKKSRKFRMRVAVTPDNEAEIEKLKESGKFVFYFHESRWRKLYNKINKSDTVYVKPAAFDWRPVEIGGSTGDGDVETRTDRITKAKQKLDQAKAILIAAGATNIF